jgi:hypothetical protein
LQVLGDFLERLTAAAASDQTQPSKTTPPTYDNDLTDSDTVTATGSTTSTLIEIGPNGTFASYPNHWELGPRRNE